MQPDYEVIIAGLGAMGSAAACHLSRRGCRVLGLDRFHPPHNLGSSHGLTRIIREAYFEHPLYVPLVQRAYELWAALEKESGRRLLLQTGGLMIGPPEGVIVRGALRSANEHRLAHQSLSPPEIRQRFPGLHPAPNMVGVWEPRAGVLFPELAVQTHLELAAKNGARLRFDEALLKWEPADGGVRVVTTKGNYAARQLLISSGAWLEALVPELKLPLTVERQVLFWFEPRVEKEAFKPANCPIHIWEYAPHQFFYGFPDLGDGLKVAFHHAGEKCDPDRVRREVDPSEIETMRRLLRQFMPAADGALKSAAVCMYTNAPDEHFVLDRHPAYRQVLIASPCSGHGFKFSPVIGEIAAAMLLDERSGFDLSLFGVGRLMRGNQPQMDTDEPR
jgi:sarcosine oxidase